MLANQIEMAESIDYFESSQRIRTSQSTPMKREAVQPLAMFVGCAAEFARTRRSIESPARTAWNVGSKLGIGWSQEEQRTPRCRTAVAVRQSQSRGQGFFASDCILIPLLVGKGRVCMPKPVSCPPTNSTMESCMPWWQTKEGYQLPALR